MRLGLAQINPTVGDLDGNARLIVGRIREAREAGCDLVVLPELCLCGYPPKDLLLQEGFLEANAAAAEAIGKGETAGIAVIFGVPLRGPGGRGIANGLQMWRDGVLVGEYRKRLLPTYDVFDEDRYFTPGAEPMVAAVGRASDRGPSRVGLSICEDLWKGEDAGFASRYEGAADPVPELAAAGAEVIVNPSASPFVLGKGAKHRSLLARHARAQRCYVAAVNQVGGNDDLIFDGHAAVYSPAGELVAAGPGFEEALTVVDLPRETAVADPLLGAAEEELLYKALVLGTRDYCRKTGFAAAVLGISGGIDSAVAAAIGVAALGPGNVTGLVMPGVYSSEHSKEDAFELARRLGMRAVTAGIDAPVEGFRGVLDGVFGQIGARRLGEVMPDLTEENLQSRVRGTMAMAFSNRTGAIVLTTGNKSELAVGYCTLYGDMNGGLAVLSDVGKVQVYRLARWMNANHRACGFAEPPIPERSITKAPSAELRPNQTDQDSLPPYEVLDEIVARYVEGRQSPARIERETGFNGAVVRRVVRMIDLSEYKRRQAAIGLKVTTVAFGSGRRWPVAQGWRGGAGG